MIGNILGMVCSSFFIVSRSVFIGSGACQFIDIQRMTDLSGIASQIDEKTTFKEKVDGTF